MWALRGNTNELSDVDFWFYDVDSSYNCETEFTNKLRLHHSSHKLRWAAQLPRVNPEYSSFSFFPMLHENESNKIYIIAD